MSEHNLEGVFDSHRLLSSWSNAGSFRNIGSAFFTARSEFTDHDSFLELNFYDDIVRLFGENLISHYSFENSFRPFSVPSAPPPNAIP